MPHTAQHSTAQHTAGSGRPRLGSPRLGQRIAALLATPKAWTVARIWRALGRPPVSLATMSRRIREVAVWRHTEVLDRLHTDVARIMKILVCHAAGCPAVPTTIRGGKWRHLDFGRWKVILQAALRRVDCQGCGQVRSEWMPWGRPGSRHSQDFEDTAG